LAILDLSANGHQPMLSRDGRFCLTFNGEIYNFRELRRELEQQGATFKSVSDTEVILEGWAFTGPAFLERLRGMFALAMWDRDSDTGYLVRDTFGIKPLYVAERDGQVFFASEVRALLATGLVERTLSPEGVASYLATGSVAEPITILAGVNSVPAGSVVKVSRSDSSFRLGKAVQFSNFFPQDGGEHRSRGEHVSRIRSALEESVRYHLVSDVPVGIFLSGGIDSSAVAGLASRAAAIPLESFTVVFKETDYSEAASASASARRFGMKHHEVMLSGRDLLNALPDVFAAMDQPSLDGLNTFVVSRAVRAYGLKAVMSGLGGDELFGGYPSFFRAQRIAPLWRLPGVIREFGAVCLSPFDDLRARRVRSMLAESNAPAASYRASRTLFDDRSVEQLMASRGQTTTHKAGSPQAGRDLSHMSIAQQVSIHELTGYMRNTLLRDSDVFTMAHALELRVPFVDMGVAAVAHAAALDLRLKAGAIKPLLVDAVRDLLPPGAATRPKSGFTLPFEMWMRKELLQEVDSMMNETAAKNVGLEYLDVKAIWRAFLDRKPGVNWSRPWALYTLIRWAQQNEISYQHSVTAARAS
jgi:asparagine synthase (glutamine-hydrolysing)